ncbi:MAG: hypothetical protein NVS4B8_02140 [Herpetosiphon sp.]
MSQWSHRLLSRSARLISVLMLPLLIAGPVLAMPSKATPQKVVEHWQGTIHSQTRFNVEANLLGLYRGWAAESYDAHWKLEVDDTGYMHGDVSVTLNSYVLEQPQPFCLASATNCVVVFDVTQPHGSYVVEGRRFTDAAGKPAMSISNTVTIANPHIHTTTSGLVFGAFPFKQDGDTEQAIAVELIAPFTIQPGNLGRAPLARSRDAAYADNNIEWSYTGYLTGTGEEPVLEVDPELLQRSRFFSKVPVDNRLDGKIEWNSADAGWVTWKVAQEQPRQVGPTRAKTVPDHQNVGFDSPGTKLVVAQAHNTIGKDSKPETKQLKAIPWPVSAISFANVKATKEGDVVHYSYEYAFPKPALTAQVSNVPDFVPFFGGGPLGIEKAQAKGAVEVTSTGEGSMELSGAATFNGMRGSLSGSVSVQADARLDEATGVSFPSGAVGLKVSGTLKSKKALLELIPPLAAQITFIQSVCQACAYAINIATVEAKITPAIDLKLKVKDDKGDLAFVSFRAKPSIGVRASLNLELVKDTAEAEIGVGGQVAAGIKVPAPYFDNGELKLTANGKLTIGKLELDKEFEVTCTLTETVTCTRSDGGALPAGIADLQGNGSGWHTIDRAYLSAPDYGRWTGSQAPSTRPSAIGNPPSTVFNTQLVANVYPRANPSLAVVPDKYDGIKQALVAWTHDKPGAPAASSGEIMWASRDRTTWSTAAPLTNDNVDDSNPHVYWPPRNPHPLIVWQRMDTANPGDLNTNPAAYFAHMQIAAAEPNLSDPTILPTPSMLSVVPGTTSSLSYRPQIVGGDNRALVTWINNPGNQVGGDAARPDNLMWATYDYTTATRSPPAPLLTAIPGLLDYHLAMLGSQAVLVYSQATDADLKTPGSKLFYLRYANGAWQSPQPMDAGGLNGASPQVAYTADGTPLFVWRTAATLLWRKGYAGPGIPFAPEIGGARNDYQLIGAADGTLALTWQDVEANDTRLGYALFEPTTGLWSNNRSVEPPVPSTPLATTMTTHIAPALVTGTKYDHDAVIAAYQLTSVTSITHTVAGVSYPNVQQVGPSSLNFIESRLTQSLAIAPRDIRATPTGARPGQQVTINAQIHNTGDLPISDIQAVLLLSGHDFDTKDTLLLTRTLSLLKAGETGTVEFPYTLPVTTPLQLGVKVFNSTGPSGLVSNVAYAPAGTDLNLRSTATRYGPKGAIVTALVAQNGGLYNSIMPTATLRLDAPDGPLLRTVGAAFPITPTDTVRASAFISSTNLTPGRHTVYWTLDPTNVAGSNNQTHNQAISELNVLPDLTTDPALVGWDQTPGASKPISLRINNDGDAPSAPTIVVVYDAPPGISAAHQVARINVPAIAAGGYAELTATLNLQGTPAATSGLAALFLQIDPGNTIAELDKNNNLLAVGIIATGPYTGQLASNIFLPLSNR